MRKRNRKTSGASLIGLLFLMMMLVIGAPYIAFIILALGMLYLLVLGIIAAIRSIIQTLRYSFKEDSINSNNGRSLEKEKEKSIYCFNPRENEVPIEEQTTLEVRHFSTFSRQNKHIPREEIVSFNEIKKCVASRFIAFDVETTGLNPLEDRVVEISAVVFQEGQIVDKYSSLIKVGHKISYEAQMIHGIRGEDLLTAPDEKVVYEELVSFLGIALNGEIPLCAHNAEFDISFLCNSLERLNIRNWENPNWKIRFIDTLRQARMLIEGVKDYKLPTLKEYMGLTMNSHRAENDAIVCGNLLCKLNQIIEEREQKDRIIRKSLEPYDYQLEVCAMVFSILHTAGSNLNWLSFARKGDRVACRCFYDFLELRFANNMRSVIVSVNAAKRSGLYYEEIPSNKYNEDKCRVFFQSPKDLLNLKEEIITRFDEAEKKLIDYLYYDSYHEYHLQDIRNTIANPKLGCQLTEYEVEELISKIEVTDYSGVKTPYSP